jgi:hypothetical protein
MAGATLIREKLFAVRDITIDSGDRHIGRQRGEVSGDICNRLTISKHQRHRAHLGPGRVVGICAAFTVLEIPELADQVGL